MSFQDLNLHQGILKAIESLGHTAPTSIQLEAIPKILEGCDLRGSSKTGSGKTGAFLIPIINKLAEPSTLPGKGPRALVLVPTRELAIQVAAEANKYSKFIPRFKTVCIYGGAPYPVQNRELSRPLELLIATPGRLMDHMERGKIDFSRLEVLVLDEADRMLDMGFIEPVEFIAGATPETRQTLLFSATMRGSVLNLSKKLLKNPVEISVASTEVEHKNIAQSLYQVDDLNHKNQLLEHLLIDESVKQVIIFTATKHHADQLKDELCEMGHTTAALHGDMNQGKRNRTINDLRKGHTRVLVATDVAARGIDIPTISHVINFDLPNSAEDYVHRIGRTGRAGATGIALSFASTKDFGLVRRIEQFTGNKIPVAVVEGMEPKKRFSSEPRGEGRGSERRGPRGGGRSRPAPARGGARPFDGERSSRPERAPFQNREERGFSKPRAPRQENSFAQRGRTFSDEQFFAEGAYTPQERRAPRAPRQESRSFVERPFRREERAPREERPFGRETRAPREDRPFSREARAPREDRSFGREARAPREDRPFGREERAPQGERAPREKAPMKKKAFFGEGAQKRPFNGAKKPPFASRGRS